MEWVLHQRGKGTVHVLVNLANPVFTSLHRVFHEFFKLLSPHPTGTAIWIPSVYACPPRARPGPIRSIGTRIMV